MTSEIIAAIHELRNEVRALRSELAAQKRHDKTPRQVRLERRHAMLRELAGATGPLAWDTVEGMVEILCGEREPPKGYESIVRKLQDDPETPTSQRGIWRVISTGN